MTNITPILKFSIGYYDGPINGVCLMNNQLCYFDSEDILRDDNCDNCDGEGAECICYIDRMYTTYHISYVPMLRLRLQHKLFRFFVHFWGSTLGFNIWYNWIRKSRLYLDNMIITKTKLSNINGFQPKKTIRR